MMIKAQQLVRHVEAGLKSVYLIYGDEPLLVLEAAEAVRLAAGEAGFSDRLVFNVDASFDWGQLRSEASARSLFSTRRILDVRLPSAQPGKQGGAVLRELAQHLDDDLLLLTTGRLDRRAKNTAWYKSLAEAGVVVPCWPVSLQELPGWLDRRMQQRGLKATAAAVRALAERVEGNLLAAAQEVDKLQLWHFDQAISVADIERLSADNARFDVFELLDAALSGDAARALRMLRSLRAEDSPLPVLAWALTKEVRTLCRLRAALDSGGNLEKPMREAGVWENRKALLQRAMRRLSLAHWQQALRQCAALDRLVKGQQMGDPWLAAERLALLLAVGERRSGGEGSYRGGLGVA